MGTTKPTDGHDITGFSPKEWTGQPFKEAGTMFIGSGFMTFLLCLLLMIFIPPLRDFAVIITVCTAAAVCGVVLNIAVNVQRDKMHLSKMTEDANAFLVEATGDPNSRLTADRLKFMILNKEGGLSLQVNGVPGLEIEAVHQGEGMVRIVALLTPPDYGLESFDVLLESETLKVS